MARLLVIYKKRMDSASFDRHYFATHVPLVKAIPGLRKYEISHGPVGTPAGESDVHLIASLYFDDLAAMQAGMSSAQGRAAAADAEGFMGAKDSLLVFDTRDI
jgi:uncharacterized protein (TIGR02118 family)